jgi:membrane-associated phospholipid phosphatase
MPATPIRRRTGIVAPLRLADRVLYGVSVPALLVVLAGAAMLMATHNAPPFQRVDDTLYRWLLESRTPALTGLNQVLNFVGKEGVVIYAVLLFVALMVRHRRLAYFTAGANIGVFAATQLMKFVVARPRPGSRLVMVDSGSYPSGHVSATAAAMVATAVVLGKLWMWVSGAILTVAMMYSRMYLAAHWFSDTVAGALLGAGLTLLLWALVQDPCLNPHKRSGYGSASTLT